MNTESQQQIAREAAEALSKVNHVHWTAIILSAIERATEGCWDEATQDEIAENKQLRDRLLSALAAIEKIKDHSGNTDQVLIFNMCHSVDLSLLHEHDAELKSKWEEAQ